MKFEDIGFQWMIFKIKPIASFYAKPFTLSGKKAGKKHPFNFQLTMQSPIEKER